MVVIEMRKTSVELEERSLELNMGSKDVPSMRQPLLIVVD